MNAMRSNADYNHALHNSGPSPSAVYRTAPVGQLWVLDLFSELRASALVPRRVRVQFEPLVAEYDDRLPMPEVVPALPSSADLVVPVVAAIMLALPPLSEGAARPALILPGRANLEKRRRLFAEQVSYTEPEALLALQQLAAHLAVLQRLVPVQALVQWVPRGSSPNGTQVFGGTRGALPWLPSHSAEHDEALRLAWLVCVFSCAAPPLVLFTRPPSLRYWRADGCLQLRWLGTAGGVA